MVVNGRPLKRMKRRVTADLNDFLTFPSGDSPVDGPFRTSVRSFLAKHALLPPPSSLLPQLLTRQILFRVGDPAVLSPDSDPDPATVCLDVIEENVARSRSVYCDQCRVVEYLLDTDIVSNRFQRRDVYGAWEQYLGLEHSDNAPKRSYSANQNRHTFEKPVRIYN